jgi:hypothetical protein
MTTTRTLLRRPLAGLAVVAALSGAALTSPFSAQAAPTAPSPAAAPDTVTHANTLSPAVRKLVKGTGLAAEAKAVSAYWTPTRMKAANVLDDKVIARSGLAPRQKTALRTAPAGPAARIAPARAATAPKALKAPSTIAPQSFYPNLPYYYPAARTNGKVFFTRAGLNYVCSATIVNSEGKSLVWTAGHCVVDGKIWDSNFAFVPSYSNGSRPYGTWYSRQLTTTSSWYYNRDFTQDVGAATMYRNFGYRITDYLGGQGLAWNQPANFYTCAFGYPQAPPYTGAYLTEACGSTYNAGNGTIYMFSGLTGGSSGGAWYKNFDGNWGYVNGHNDFIYTGSPQWMYSPYYGNQVASLYNAVRYQTS